MLIAICIYRQTRILSNIFQEKYPLRLLGGGRLPPSERKYRRKQANEQIKAGIGKSVWRREHGRLPSKAVQQAEKISSLKSNLDFIKSAIGSRKDPFPVPVSESAQGSSHAIENGVEQLDDLENKARELLQTIKKEKGAAIREERKSKRNRRQLKRSEVRNDPSRNHVLAQQHLPSLP